jgi:hypothetical protein
MKLRMSRRTVAAGTGAVLLALGAGAAVAATTLDRAEESEAIIDSAAERLGVESSELTAALKEALAERVDAAVADGRLTEEQGERVKERIAADDYPLVGMAPGKGGHGPGFGHGRGGYGGPLALDAAADYLGLTPAELHERLHEEGATLASIAEAEGKTVEGLVDALVAAGEERLDAAVEAGRITQERRDELAGGLRERITEAVNREHPSRGPGRRSERPSA